MARVVVVGSLNGDHTVRVPRFPESGETLSALEYTTDLGGKGFNQAVTVARMGAETVMVGCIGADTDGDALVLALAREGIDAGYVRRTAELPTGRAHITVDAAGRNMIVVAAGANAAATFPSAALEGADVLLAQLECPLPVVSAAMTAARAAGVVTILNAAPAAELTDRFLEPVDYLVANEHEADHLGQVSYRGTAIVTAGERGVTVLMPGEAAHHVRALPVAVVDSTAAGDAFCGCLAASLAEGRSLAAAVRRASAAGAFAVTASGAFASLPYSDEVDDLVAQADRESHS